MRHLVTVLKRDGTIETLQTVRPLQLAPRTDLLAIAVIDQRDAACGVECSCRSLLDLAASDKESRVLLLISWRRPPVTGVRNDGPINSFVCSWAAFSNQSISPESNFNIFDLLTSVIASAQFPRVWALQFPCDLPLANAFCSLQPDCTSSSIDWVIPHAGDHNFLISCLKFVRVANESARGAVFIGIDDPWSENYTELQRSFPEVNWHQSLPPKAGPYVIKNALINKSQAKLICFQDSDDVPCANRLALLSLAVAGLKAAMIGSHEIRVNEITREVHAVRFPLNVDRCLTHGPLTLPLLHASAITNREQFMRAGGFSCAERFSMDTQFLYRSHFLFPSRNVDAFLYIRKVHRTSLTNSPSTHTRSFARLKVLSRLKKAFADVNEDLISLSNSALCAGGSGLDQLHSVQSVNSTTTKETKLT